MSHHLHRHAVVIGASMAGLATARVLAEHFDAVTILERDQLTTAVRPRKGVPQGRHAHALLAGGARAIEALFPGITEEMIGAGAALLDFNAGTWYQEGGYRARSLVERKVVSASRPFLEGHVRRRVTALPNVTIVGGVTVYGLATRDGRVRGVEVIDGDGARVVMADLVVDCSGRASQAPSWLRQAGYDEPEVLEVRCDTRYATLVMRRRPEHVEDSFHVIIESPPHGKRAAFLLPIEDDRWMLTLGCGFGAPAPVDLEGLLDSAATLPVPEVHDALTAAEPLTPVANHRLLTSKRRRYEKLRRVPAGFLVLGDAICSFNPIYGQGMSSAVLQAVELGACLAGHDNDATFVKAFYRQAAKVIANPWQITVGADFAYPEATGPKPFGTDIVNRYVRRVLQAAQVSPEVNTAMIMVQNLLRPPRSLLRPAMIRQVRRAAKQAQAARLHPSAPHPARVLEPV